MPGMPLSYAPAYVCIAFTPITPITQPQSFQTIKDIFYNFSSSSLRLIFTHRMCSKSDFRLSRTSSMISSRVLRDSTPRYLGPLVGWSVGRLVGQSVGRSPFWAAAPKGPMTYAFTQGKFLLHFQCTPPRFKAHIPGLRLKSHAQGSNTRLKAQIPGSRLKSQARGSNPRLEAQIPATRLISQP